MTLMLTPHQRLLFHKETGTTVYLASTLPSEELILKKIRFSESSKGFQHIKPTDVEREIMANARFGLLKGYTIKDDADHQTRTYELLLKKIPGECLADFLQNNQLSSQEWLNVLYFMTKSLQKIHKHHYAHRDVRADNFIINPQDMKLIDFGFSIPKDMADENVVYGNPFYVADETLRNEINNQQSDLTSLGVCFGYHLGFIQFGTAQRIRPDFNDNAPEALTSKGFTRHEINVVLSLIKGLLESNPDDRPSLDTIRNELGALIQGKPNLEWVQGKKYEPLTIAQNKKIKIIPFKPMKLSDLNPGHRNHFAEFDVCLEQLKLKRSEFESKKDDHDKYHRAYSAIDQLISTLENEVSSLESSSETYYQFKDHCQAAIDVARPELSHHRGVSPLLKNIGLAILGLGVFYLIPFSYRYVTTGKIGFFKHTDSENKLNAFEDVLNRP